VGGKGFLFFFGFLFVFRDQGVASRR